MYGAQFYSLLELVIIVLVSTFSFVILPIIATPRAVQEVITTLAVRGIAELQYSFSARTLSLIGLLSNSQG